MLATFEPFKSKINQLREIRKQRKNYKLIAGKKFIESETNLNSRKVSFEEEAEKTRINCNFD